jgi:type IV pilus assembly protein PilN
MIKINLLAGDRQPARTPFAVTAAHKVGAGCAAILLTACALIGWSYWNVTQASTRMDLDIAVAQQETTRLRGVLQQVQQFEQQKSQLQQRVALIEQLRKQQTGPVHMLDQISRALPAMLWLTELKQDEKTGAVVIEGRCATLTSLSDFVANLEGSGYFKRSVEILNTHTNAGRDGAELVQFSVRAQFVQPGTAAEPATEK